MSRRGSRTSTAEKAVGPTPERIARAGEGYTIGGTGRMRFAEAPLDRLRERCALDPDRDVNRALFEAGDRLRTDWRNSGLGGSVPAIDYGRSSGGGGDPVHGMPTTEFAAAARWRFRNAMRALDPREATVVGYIVLDELSPIESGRGLGRKAHQPLADRQAQALALLALRIGLTTLARHYHLLR